MTEKLHLITAKQLDTLLQNALLTDDIAMLQSLPMVTDEPVATVTDVPPAFGYSTYIRWYNSPPSPTGTRLYTSPQALTPITADDVTDEMLDALNTNTHPASTRAEILAAAYNAVIKHKVAR